jgi:amino acid transporter
MALTGVPLIPVALAHPVLISIILFYGINQFTKVAIVFMVIETLGLLAVIALGLPAFGKVNYLEMPPDCNESSRHQP